MYYYMDIADEWSGQTIRNIFRYLPDGGVQSFPNIDSNDGPERRAYLAWLAEGNQPEEAQQ